MSHRIGTCKQQCDAKHSERGVVARSFGLPYCACNQVRRLLPGQDFAGDAISTPLSRCMLSQLHLRKALSFCRDEQYLAALKIVFSTTVAKSKTKKTACVAESAHSLIIRSEARLPHRIQ
jgi:hypothetical protein